MSYGLPRRSSGALESSPGWAEALGGILGTVGSFMQAKQQHALQQQQLDRQKMIDQQNATLHGLQVAGLRGSLTAQGLDDKGGQLPDPYVQQQQAQVGPMVQTAPQGETSDQALQGFAQKAATPIPNDPMAHAIALTLAGQTAPAARYRQQYQDQQTGIDKRIQRTSEGFDMSGNSLPDDYQGQPQGATAMTDYGNFQDAPNYRDQGVDMLRHADFLDKKGQGGVAAKLRASAKEYIAAQDKIDADKRARDAATALAVFRHLTTTETNRHNTSTEGENRNYHGQLGKQFATAEGGRNSRNAATIGSAQSIAAGRDATTRRGQDLGHQDRVRGQDLGVQRFNAGALNKSATDIYGAWGRLQKVRGVKPPTDDPNFSTHLSDFAKLTPAGRDQFMASKAIPDSTKGILRRLGAPSLPQLLTAPAAGGEDDDE